MIVHDDSKIEIHKPSVITDLKMPYWNSAPSSKSREIIIARITTAILALLVNGLAVVFSNYPSVYIKNLSKKIKNKRIQKERDYAPYLWQRSTYSSQRVLDA